MADLQIIKSDLIALLGQITYIKEKQTGIIASIYKSVFGEEANEMLRPLFEQHGLLTKMEKVFNEAIQIPLHPPSWLLESIDRLKLEIKANQTKDISKEKKTFETNIYMDNGFTFAETKKDLEELINASFMVKRAFRRTSNFSNSDEVQTLYEIEVITYGRKPFLIEVEHNTL